MNGAGRPVVAIATNRRELNGFSFHASGENYITSAMGFAEATPILLPAMLDPDAVGALVAGLHGVVLTGGASNIQPHFYGEDEEPDSGERDPGRDSTAFALTHACLEHGVPLLGICRGIQEMNVALGGSLHQHLRFAPGKFDHRRPREKPVEEQLAPRHGIAIRHDGMLAGILDGAREVKVNSLHGQGIKKVADRLIVEATAADGSIEAVSVRGAKSFALGLQWHAEADPGIYPVHERIWRAFGDACRQRRAAVGG